MVLRAEEERRGVSAVERVVKRCRWNSVRGSILDFATDGLDSIERTLGDRHMHR